MAGKIDEALYKIIRTHFFLCLIHLIHLLLIWVNSSVRLSAILTIFPDPEPNVTKKGKNSLQI